LFFASAGCSGTGAKNANMPTVRVGVEVVDLDRRVMAVLIENLSATDRAVLCSITISGLGFRFHPSGKYSVRLEPGAANYRNLVYSSTITAASEPTGLFGFGASVNPKCSWE